MKKFYHEPFTSKFFSIEEKELLLSLFRTYGMSDHEEHVADFVCENLVKLGITFERDKNNNIFNFNNIGKPLLSAHMDCVGKKEDAWFADFINIFPYGNDEILKGIGNIGGDDKCGVFLILLILIKYHNINFIFSVGEEIGGGKGIKTIDFKKMKEENIIEKIPYCLVLDRRNSGDIICEKNNYGSKEFEEALAEIGKDFNYSPERGACSDANTISDYLNSANLSVAYYNPHTQNEFVSLRDLENTRYYIEAIIEKLEGRFFKLNEKPVYNSAYNSFNSYSQYESGSELYSSYNYRTNLNYCSSCKTYVKTKDYNFTFKKCDECLELEKELKGVEYLDNFD